MQLPHLRLGGPQQQIGTHAFRAIVRGRVVISRDDNDPGDITFLRVVLIDERQSI